MSMQITGTAERTITAIISGQLKMSELKQAEQAAAKQLQQRDKTHLLLILQDFQGFEKGEWNDTSFRAQHDAQIDKLAIVGDAKWELPALMFVGKGIRKVDIEFFPSSDLEKARSWLASTGGQSDAATAR